MIPYSLHVAIILSVCLGFYKLLLQKQTYYQLNRLVLLTCLLLAFILPILSVPQQFSMRNANLIANENDFESDVSVMHTSTKKHADLEKTEVFNSEMVIKWVGWFYWFGVAAFGLSFLLQAVVLFYQSHKNKWVKDGIYKIVELETNKAPCSFGNYIFINPTKYDWDTYNRILLHEKIHVKERHSIDLVLSELMLVFQWFNPMAWFYRASVENNLEFLTDDTVLQQHQVDPTAYQWSLLQVTVPNYALRIATNYNQSLLEKRIIMMDAKKSNVHTLWKYVMLFPVLALLVCGLNKPVAMSKPLASKPNTIHRTVTKDPNPAAVSDKNMPVQVKKRETALGEDVSARTNNDIKILKDKVETIGNNTKEAVVQRNIPLEQEYVVQQDTIRPRFPGGREGWGLFLRGYNFPKEAREYNAKGPLYIKFMVQIDGTLTDFAIVKDLKYGTGEEAIRLMKTSPKWVPATVDGRKVAVWVTQTINLMIN